MTSMSLRSQRSMTSEDDTRMSHEELVELRADIKTIIQKQNESQELLKSLNAQVSNLKEECIRKDNQIKALEVRVNDLEQYTRQDDIIITGLKTKHQSYARRVNTSSSENHGEAPSTEIESLEKQVINFLSEKDFEIDEKDISIVHTLKSNNTHAPKIIMRMISRKAKINILKQSWKLKETIDNRREPKVYLNEHLTRNNSHLYKIARDLKKKNMIKGTFSRNCKIFVRTKGSTPEEERILMIRDMAELIKLGHKPDD